MSAEQMGWTHLGQELQPIHSVCDFFLLLVSLKTGATVLWLLQIEQTLLQSLSNSNKYCRSCVYVLVYKIIHNIDYKMYLQNKKMAKFWVFVDFSNRFGLNKYIKLLCKMKLWDELQNEKIIIKCSVKKVF